MRSPFMELERLSATEEQLILLKEIANLISQRFNINFDDIIIKTLYSMCESLIANNYIFKELINSNYRLKNNFLLEVVQRVISYLSLTGKENGIYRETIKIYNNWRKLYRPDEAE